MKIQCSCGTKYSFDITPEMARQPVRFVCPACGVDSSGFVNELIRQELAGAPPAPETLPPEASAAQTEAPPSATARVRIQAAKPPTPGDSARNEGHSRFCAKHPGQATTHQCLVCQRPMCPKCMELFGYVCSPHCAAQAETKGISVPVYKGKKSVIERRRWRNAGAVTAAAGLVIAGLLGFWFWYAWIGSVPKPVFSVRFDEPVPSGQSAFCGENQIVFVRGLVLSRYDLEAKKEIWSRRVLDKTDISEEVTRMTLQMEAEKKSLEGKDSRLAELFEIPSPDKLASVVERLESAGLQLHVDDRNVWVATARKMTRYDWETGKPLQDVALPFGPADLVPKGDELLVLGVRKSGEYVVNHIGLRSGETRVEIVGEPARPSLADARAAGGKHPARHAGAEGLAGLPTTPGQNTGRPMDPAKVEEQVQNLSGPARIALPAVLASERSEERIFAAANDAPNSRSPDLSAQDLVPAEPFAIIPSDPGYLQFSVKLLEARFVEHKAMAEPSGKSALDDPNLNASKSAEVVNDFLNERQREIGGATITVDESRYEVTVRRPDVKNAAEWKGEVTGRPEFYALKTVSVVAAGKTLVVLDKDNRKLWEASLIYNVAEGSGPRAEIPGLYGLGPCAQHGNVLYVADEATLTAFDADTGSVKWRLPSVGVAGMFFDDDGMMYVNTTTAGLERIKLPRQIDVTRKTADIVLKLDAATGRVMWTATEGGFVTYVSGKYVYMLHTFDAHESEFPRRMQTGLEMPSHVTIRRINPKTGNMMWEHYQQRAPLDVQFSANRILLVFRKEVQVLRFVSF